MKPYTFIYSKGIEGYTSFIFNYNSDKGYVITKLKKCTKVYSFGFNGQERDNEISGAGNIYTAEFWEYDARLGRRFNIDPVVKHWESGYATFSNNPIFFADPTGESAEDPQKTYKVEKGNTLSGIAKAHNTSVDELMKANPQIKNKHKIYEGQSLNLPPSPEAGQSSPTPTAAPLPNTKATVEQITLQAYQPQNPNQGIAPPIGTANPVVAVAAVAVVVVAELINNPPPTLNISLPNAISTVMTLMTVQFQSHSGIMFSKHGKQNLWDDEISHLSPDAWIKWKQDHAGQKQRIKTEEKRRGNANKQKRKSRGW